MGGVASLARSRYGPGMIRLLAIVALSLLTSCEMLGRLGSHEKTKPKDTDSTGAKQQEIGAVELVNPEQRFVLIRTPADILIPAGTVLYSTNPQGEAVKLKVTPERKGSFLAADIVSGNPQKEDAVMYQAVSQEPPLPGASSITPAVVSKIETPPPPTPPTPQKPPAGEPVPSEFLRPSPPQPQQ